MANLHDETKRLICTLCDSNQGPYVVSANYAGEVHAVPLSSVSGCGITVNAGTTPLISDDSNGTATVRCGETIHFWSPDDSVQISVVDGSAIISFSTTNNLPPTITIVGLDPGDILPNTITIGEVVELDAIANDPDGTVTNITYYVNSVVECNLPQPGITTCNFTPTTDGNYDIEAVATDNLGATAISNVLSVNVQSTVGYFASPTALPTGDGSIGNPWTIRDGLADIPDGECLNLLSGVFNERLDTGGCGTFYDNIYRTSKSNITVKPWVQPTCANPYPVTINGAIYNEAGTTNNLIRDIRFINPDPVPGGEPTAPGGGQPTPTPPCWFDWGASGPGGEGFGHKYINNHVRGGASGLSTFQVSNIEMYGNVVWDFGWIGTDRAHGHGIYAQNPDANPVNVNRLTRNLVSNSIRGATTRGMLGAQMYKTTGNIENINFIENGIKGGVVGYSQDFDTKDLDVQGNVFISNFNDAIGSGNRWGNLGNFNDDIDYNNNTLVNCSKQIVSQVWTNLNSTGTRVFKTRATWGPTGMLAGEEGVFADVSGGGGVDDFTLQDNVYDAGRGQLITMDLDLDGSVDVDFSPVVPNGNRVCVYHYTNPDTPVIDQVYGGGNITVPLVDPAVDRGDLYFFRFE